MTYVHVNEHAQEFRTTGDFYQRKAEDEFRGGDLVQASEKAWGAVAQYLKALAVERDWSHERHVDLEQVADKLATETGNRDIRTGLGPANMLHANFYQAVWSEEGVRDLMDAAWEYLELLKEVAPPREAVLVS